jgi:Peptidase family S41
MDFKKLFLKQISTLILLTILTIHSIAQNAPLLLTKEQALQDLHCLRFSLEYVHPRLYKYDDKKTVDARFDNLEKEISNKISGLDFLALITKFNATVHCGHLYTIPQEELSKEILDKMVLPFYIKVAERKFYLFNDCSSFSIPNGSRILSINGKSDTSILNAMLPGIAADGYIETRKIKLLQRYFFYAFQGFDLYYHLFVDRSDTFKIDYVTFGTNEKKTIIVKGMSSEDRKKILLNRYHIDEEIWFKTPSPKFEFDSDSDFAVLTVSRSFYNNQIDPPFDSLLSFAFKTIKDRKIDNLILDMRNNEGGDESQQIALMSYLYDKPFRLYQNIYLSHLDFRPLKPVIIERDTSTLLFNDDDEYMRKINDNLWINNYDYSDNLQLKEPNANVFEGKLYVLMDGTCFSSAADLISDLKKTTDAIFIGEESGGAFEGPTGGDNIVIQLPNSKIMLRISLNMQIGYMYQKHPIGRGVLPTYPINYTVADFVQHKDLEMEFAKKLIQSSQNK